MVKPKIEELLSKYVSNVYLNTPNNFKMVYPCVIVSLIGFEKVRSSNKTYVDRERYEVMFITSKLDDDTVKALSNIPYSVLLNQYTVDGLRHYIYQIYI